MKINIFEGARRIGLLLKIIWVIACVVVYIVGNDPFASLHFETYGPDAPFIETATDACVIGTDATESLYDYKLDSGDTVYISLCFKAQQFDDGRMLVPYTLAVRDGEWDQFPLAKAAPTAPLPVAKAAPASNGESNAWWLDDLPAEQSDNIPAEQRKEPPAPGKVLDFSDLLPDAEPTATPHAVVDAPVANVFDQFDAAPASQPPLRNPMVWGNTPYSPDVMKYTKGRATRFNLAPSSQKEAQQFLSRQWREARWAQIWLTLKLSIAGWVLITLVAAINGWVVRGFLGIPRGQDRRVETI